MGRIADRLRGAAPRGKSGFTQVELVVIMVVIGVLALAVIPRFSNSGFDDRRLRDEAISALRFAQKSAIASRRVTCASFPDNSHLIVHVASGWATGDCTTSGPSLTGPDGNALAVAATRGASFSSYPSGWITFDALGRPSASASIGFSNLPATLAITVEAETGYVH